MYISNLDTDTQNNIKTHLEWCGVSGDDLEAAMAGKTCDIEEHVKVISAKDFALDIDDAVADGLFELLSELLEEFDRLGYIKLDPTTENNIESATMEVANDLKGTVVNAMQKYLGLAVESDGTSW